MRVGGAAGRSPSFRGDAEASSPKSRDFRVRVFDTPRNDEGRRQLNTPTIAPIRQVVSVPDTIDFNPSELISSRRSGAMVPRPPIMMPRLPKLAKPHIA